MRKPAIMLCVPSGGQWQAQMSVCAIGCALASFAAGVVVEPRGAEGCYVETNRNRLVQAALEFSQPIDGIFWNDTDMRYPPDALLRLMNRTKGICGANYRMREPPYDYLGNFLDGGDKHCFEGGLHRMDCLPAGLMLVKMDVYRKMPYPWYRAPVEPADLRDDYYFCHKARDAGFDVWCDMDVTRRISHQGVEWYKPGDKARAKDLLPTPPIMASVAA